MCLIIIKGLKKTYTLGNSILMDILQYILTNGAYDNQDIIQIYLYLYHSFHTSSESDICECCFKRLVNLLDI